MGTIRVAIAGVENCEGALLQGIEYYRGRNAAAEAGLMHEETGGAVLPTSSSWPRSTSTGARVERSHEEAVFADTLEAPGTFLMKSPPRQMRDEVARRELGRFIGADGDGGSDAADGADRGDADGDGDSAAVAIGAGPGGLEEARSEAAGRPGEGS